MISKRQRRSSGARHTTRGEPGSGRRRRSCGASHTSKPRTSSRVPNAYSYQEADELQCLTTRRAEPGSSRRSHTSKSRTGIRVQDAHSNQEADELECLLGQWRREQPLAQGACRQQSPAHSAGRASRNSEPTEAGRQPPALPERLHSVEAKVAGHRRETERRKCTFP